MKFSIVVLALLFGAFHAISVEDNADNTALVDNNVPTLMNEMEEEEERRCRLHRKKPTTERPKTISFAGACDKDKDDCQCYGKRGYCACGEFSCNCVNGDMYTEFRKLNCSNKEEWESENETAEVTKSIPIGGECDIKKTMCQCYGKRSYCECGHYKSCICTDASIALFSYVENEHIKKHCPNRQEWESEGETTEVSATVGKGIPLGDACDIYKDDCQCYGKRGACICMGGFGCSCTLGDVETEKRKRNCPNKNEWTSEIETTERPKSIPVGGECDNTKSVCQCYGKGTRCVCRNELCICTEESTESTLYKRIENFKRRCENMEEWESEYGTIEESIQFGVIPLNS